MLIIIPGLIELKLMSRMAFIKELAFLGILIISILPLAIDPFLLPPPNFGQSVLFNIFSPLIFIAVLYLWWKDRDFTLKFNSIFWLFSALIVVFVISTVFALEPDIAFWGSYDRNFGLLTHINLFLFFVSVCVLVKEKIKWQVIWDIAIVISFIQFILSIGQKFYWSFVQGFSWFSARFLVINSGGRPVGSIGNANFFSAWLLLLIFPTIYFLIKSENRARKIFYLSALLVQFYSFLLANTRVAWIAFGLTILGFIFFYPAKNRESRNMLKILAAFFLILIIGVILLANSNFGGIFLQTFPSFERLNLDDFSPVRFYAWQAGLKSFIERPIFGYGLENFHIAFAKNLNPAAIGISNLDIWFDRAHNQLVDVLVMTGIAGFITYLIFWFYIFRESLRIKTSDKLLSNIFLAGFAAYFIQNLSNFDTIAPSILFVFFLGWLINNSSYSRETNINFSPKIKVGVLGIFLASFVFIAVVLSYSLFINYKFNRTKILLGDLGSFYTSQKVDTLAQPLYQEKIYELLKGTNISRSPYRYDYQRLSFDLVLNEVQFSLNTEGYQDSGKELAEYYMNIVDGSLKNRLHEARFYLFNTILGENLYRYDKEWIDALRIENYFDKALSLSPKHPLILQEKAIFRFYQRNFKEAVEISKFNLDNYEKYEPARIMLGLSLIGNKEYEDGIEDGINELLKIFPYGLPENNFYYLQAKQVLAERGLSEDKVREILRPLRGE